MTELVVKLDQKLPFSFVDLGWQPSKSSVFRLGKLDHDEMVFAAGAGEESVYLAWLPWQNGKEATVLLTHRHASADADAIAKLHALVSSYLKCYELPLVTDQPAYCCEYEWVVSRGYVGPDRRRKETPLLSRFAWRGRRRHLPEHWPTQITPVDQMMPQTKTWFSWFLFLAVLDLVLTLAFVGTGQFRELNPMLAWSVDSPLVFGLVKFIFAISGFFLLSRYQLWRRQFLPRVGVTLYAGLILYWVVLITVTGR
jgi:hypothetical protein